jgi:uncharacterized protein YkwD
MNFDVILRWLMALPGLLLPGLLTQTTATTHPTTHQGTVVVSSSAPSATPVPPRPAPRPSGTPKPPATPRPSGTPVAGGGGKTEIASEQVCPGQGDASRATSVLVCLTSNARMFHGLAPVSANSALMAAAAAKDQDMLRCGYGHTACGREFGYWIKNKGYGGRCYGENIAMGQKTPGEVFVAWMNSAGHRANILSKDFRDIGVAEVNGSNGPLWVMELGGC